MKPETLNVKRPSPLFPVLLFDIDGVLVEPLGYRAAVQATLGYFTRQIGLRDDLLPDENVYASFEAHRITSEWDMIALELAIVLEAVSQANPGTTLPTALAGFCGLDMANHPDAVNYLPVIRLLAAHIQPGEYLPETVLRLIQAGDPHLRTLFPGLGGNPVLIEILSNTRDIGRSPTTKVFQHFSLGSENFSRTYRLPVEVETPSLLLANDRPLLSQDLRDEILFLQEQGAICGAAYTLRPSLPPPQVPGPFIGFAPEAELALELAGLSRLPLIGYGRIRSLADETGVDAEKLVKPSPFQALAAIFAALSGDELSALRIAFHLYKLDSAGSGTRWTRQNDFTFTLSRWLENYALHRLNGLSIYIFEDTPGGIEAVRKAAQILHRCGLPARVYAYGIASHPEKGASLEKIETRVFPSTSEAVRSALQTFQG